MISQNVQSINNKIHLLESWLTDHQFDAVCLSETWIKQDRHQYVQVDGYEFAASFNRRLYRGGGVAILTREGIPYKQRPDYEMLTIERVVECCAIELPNCNTMIINIYRKDRKIDMFFQFLTSLTNKLKTESFRKRIIVTGDFNINNSLNSENYNKLCNSLLECNLHQTIHAPTRVTKKTSTCIDLLFTNHKDCDVSVRENGISDHSCLFYRCKVSNKLTKLTKVTYVYKRIYSHNNMMTFKNQLLNLDWTKIILINDDINNNYNALEAALKSLLNSCIPNKRIKLRTESRTKMTWLTKGLKQSCRHKRLLRSLINQTGNDILRSHCKTYQRILKKCIKASKKLSYKKIINKSKNKIKTMWNIVKDVTKTQKTHNPSNLRLTISDKVYDCPSAIANLFNDYFMSVGESSQRRPCGRTPLKPALNSMYLQPVTEQEVYKLLKLLPNKFSSGVDEIPSALIKFCANELAAPLTILINQSFNGECFPEKLKVAKIKPLLKKGGNKNNIAHYRPIALLPAISKIFEKAMANRVYRFLEKFNLLNKNQYGFRKNRSTTHAVYKYVQEALSYINDKYYAVGILLDMTKAYDKVLHSILFSKLYGIGIRDKPFRWLQSYLGNRKQYVEINSHNNSNGGFESVCSTTRCINSSIPQGSVLGSILFLIYVNDLPDMLESLCVMFADDISLLFKCQNNSQSLNHVINNFDAVKSWLTDHNLEVNLKKTRIMQFRPYQREELDIKLITSYIKAEQVNKFDLLGLTIDSHFDWKNHIENLKKKLAQFTYALAVLKTNSDFNTALTTYYAYAHAWLQYGIMLWGHSTVANDVFILQKKCLRILSNIDFRTSCRPFFQKNRMLTVPCIYILDVVKFVRNNIAEFKFVSSSRRNNQLVLPTPRLELFRNSPYYRAISIYNKIPLNIKNEINNKTLSVKLKKYLIEKCYYSMHEFFNDK